MLKISNQQTRKIQTTQISNLCFQEVTGRRISHVGVLPIELNFQVQRYLHVCVVAPTNLTQEKIPCHWDASIRHDPLNMLTKTRVLKIHVAALARQLFLKLILFRGRISTGT